MSIDPFAPVSAVAVGTGRLTLDVIVRAGVPARSQAGGTCGNVLANLAYLGWRAHPLTDLGDDDPGDRFCADIARWGASLDLIRRIPGEESPVIIHYIRDGEHGPIHSFSSRCPFCGHRLRYYEPVSLDGVVARLDRIPQPQVFFFDRDSEGSLLLARHCRDRGALVVYEPNYAGKEVHLEEALAIADVLKFSHERLPDLLARPLDGPSLLIETHGADGLRYLDRRTSLGWQSSPSFRVATVRDAGGSGDWTTAGFVHLAGRGGAAGFAALSEDELRQALRFGQALGAWNCAFEGARGGVYCTDRDHWQRDIGRILAGDVFDPQEGCHPSTHDLAGRFCPGCNGLASA